MFYLGAWTVTPEGREKKLVKAYLASGGAYQFWPVQTGYGAATLDCLACINGHFVAIEVKKEGYAASSFTTRQRVTMETMQRAFATVFSGNAEEIIRDIEQWLSSTGASAADK